MDTAAELKRRVIVVDDEEEILNVYTTFLEYRGYEVIRANNALDALKYLKTELADMLLLDVNMPGIDGLKVLEMVRTDERLREMRVIMVSARRDEETVKEAVRLGCDGFLIKPFKMKDLAERITIELFTVTADEVRNFLRQNLAIRTSLLREPGLQEHSPMHWDSYPIRHDDMDLCLLVPRGVRPTRFVKSLTDELEKRVVVFYRHPQRWKKIFPPHRKTR